MNEYADKTLDSMIDVIDVANELSAADELRRYVENSIAPNTARAQRADWHEFVRFCEKTAQSPLLASPATVALYIADAVRTKKTGTIARYISTISVMHRRFGHPSPTLDERVRTVWAGIKRMKGPPQSANVPSWSRP